MTAAVITLAVLVAGVVPYALVASHRWTSTKTELAEAVIAQRREKERADAATEELHEYRAAAAKQLQIFREQLRRYRQFYLESTPDTPEGRQVAGDELDRELSRLAELLSEAAAREADPGREEGLPEGNPGADD